MSGRESQLPAELMAAPSSALGVTRCPRDDNYSWVDTLDAQRFVRRGLEAYVGDSSIDQLVNLLVIMDRIYDDLVVLDGCHDAMRRGWISSKPQERSTEWGLRLKAIEEMLFQLHADLHRRRDEFTSEQLARLGIDRSSCGLKLHIGAAGHPIDGWLNVDIADSDLNINVNWGIPLRSGSVARVYCAHLIEHLRYRDQAPAFLRELFRVLEPGGVARFVVPDVRRLLLAYSTNDSAFFDARKKFYRVGEGFERAGIPTLDYLLLFCGAGPQTATLNHKFGYDFDLLSSLLAGAGFSEMLQSSYQGSLFPDLNVDDVGYNAGAHDHRGISFSLFVDAVK